MYIDANSIESWVQLEPSIRNTTITGSASIGCKLYETSYIYIYYVYIYIHNTCVYIYIHNISIHNIIYIYNIMYTYIYIYVYTVYIYHIYQSINLSINQIKWNQMKSNEIKSNQIKSHIYIYYIIVISCNFISYTMHRRDGCLTIFHAAPKTTKKHTVAALHRLSPTLKLWQWIPHHGNNNLDAEFVFEW